MPETNVIVYTIGSVMLVSAIAVAAIIPFFFKKRTPKWLLVTLLSLSAGTLLGSVFLHFIPEITEEGYTLSSALFILIGFALFFIIEKLIHWHHHHGSMKGNEREAHSHAYHLAPINLIGDGVHNFIDGIVIAASYSVSIPLGVAATVSVVFHELPQEIADFGVLLYAGLSKGRAIIFNLFSAMTAIFGAIVGLVFTSRVESFHDFIIPFTVGSFIYIAAANLVPELHRHCKWWETIVHVTAMAVGVGIMVALSFVASEHMH